MRLSGKTALVTGAARGIGKAIAVAFAREGAEVVVCDRDEEAAELTAQEIGPSAVAVRADISNDSEVNAMVDFAVARFGKIDILVNNAGVGATTLFLESTREEFERVVRINLTGTFMVSQAVARKMAERKTGSIVNIASLSGQKGGVGRSAYGASKAGVELLNKVMAVELADLGINVNAIAPGPILTEVSRTMHTLETRDAYHRLVPQRRYGEPEEIADAAVFLASDEARYITGHTLNVDGGFLAAGLLFPFDAKTSTKLADEQ
ncbi:SDR family oxidoreductase (plasmid) [Agrobacterium salinitolerans]|uniref:SDR family oxidoreductase n=1 Tax=Agrobacterium salinitolerans TaxID=1183413 RepID=A0A4Z1QRR3_9HYPH|nr:MULTISPECIES: SDR family NAD(P)-dependent oxidoreductase [Agrobacterium]MDH6298072.1 NAD(P)-dependent dehydrogenase (short-subunit alcohol dehydrogenase family) [Agrobacterium fabrum]UYZ11108.1 SDR family oxidoreductase [Agrobacterium salinitolerans]